MVEFFYNFLIHTLWGGGGGGDRGRGDVTAILQPKILKEIDFAWVQQVGMLKGGGDGPVVVHSFIAKTEGLVCREVSAQIRNLPFEKIVWVPPSNVIP